MWMINTVTQFILFVFAIILIGITGDYVNKHYPYEPYYTSGLSNLAESLYYLLTKYRLHQVQLTFAVLMFFSAILFIGLFLYLYLIARSFSESVVKSVNPTNNNNPSGIQQQQQISWVPIPSSNNQMSIATPSDVVLKDIQCPHSHATVPLPVPNRTCIHTQQLHAEYVPVQ